MGTGNYVKFILALLFVLGLIGLLATLVRRYGIGLPQISRRRGQDKRLGLVEIMPLDPKRRLVLIKRDQVEHLVILGPGTETVVETNITPCKDDTQDFAETLKHIQAPSLASQKSPLP